MAMPRAMDDHDCFAEMDVWERSEDQTSQYLLHQENEFCRRNFRQVGWNATEASVSAFFRCDLDDRFAEYAITIYRDPTNVTGRSWRQYTIKSKGADLGLGMNFTVEEPNPAYPESQFDNKKLLFSDKGRMLRP